MTDPEVARLRRLRSDALLVREVARAFESSSWAGDEPILEGSACAAWRIARAVSGRLRSHPYAEYQRDLGWAARLGQRATARCIAMTHPTRSEGLTAVRGRLQALSRRLDDAVALAWSSDFSESLVRSQFEINRLRDHLAKARDHAAEVRAEGSRAVASARNLRTAERRGNGLDGALETDWPYLAL